MDVGGIGGGSLALETVAALTGLKQQEFAREAGVALFAKALDTQQVLATQLLQGVGIGQNLDVSV